jgi:hypothetical protein
MLGRLKLRTLALDVPPVAIATSTVSIFPRRSRLRSSIKIYVSFAPLRRHRLSLGVLLCLSFPTFVNKSSGFGFGCGVLMGDAGGDVILFVFSFFTAVARAIGVGTGPRAGVIAWLETDRQRLYIKLLIP